MRNSFLILFFSVFTTVVCAQTVSDALRFSSIDPSGTARFMATGGALGPLGADLSVTGTNPAGVGLYRISEFTISPAFFSAGADAGLTAAGTSMRDSRSTLNFHNIGVVMTSQPLSPTWKSMNFAITLNNIGNFNRRFSYSGATTGSIAQRWAELANSSGLESFEAGLASDVGAIYFDDFDGNPDDYDIDYEGSEDQLLLKEQTLITKGSATELSFALGANYNNRVMIGLSIGVPIINFEYESVYTEQDERSPTGGNVPFFESLEYRDQYTTTGGGINAKLGVIVRVNQALRLSGAIHTPTGYTFEDELETTLINNSFEDPEEMGNLFGGEATSTGLFEYRLRTPWRFFGGAGLILGRNGFVSAEVELVNHGNNEFRYDGFQASEDAVNGDIAQSLENVLNLRLGGELVLKDIYRVRGGIGIFPSAFAGDDTRRYSLSTGAGIRQERYFFDLAYRYTTFDELFFPYNTQEAELQEVNTEFDLHRIVLTFGVKF